MAKAMPQIETLAQLIVFMDETGVGREPPRPQESLTPLQQRTADPTPDVGGPQVDPKEFRPSRRRAHVAKSNELIRLERHIKEHLVRLDQGHQGAQALWSVVDADKLVNEGGVKDARVGELPGFVRNSEHRLNVTGLQ
jgi:hypothetical protein